MVNFESQIQTIRDQSMSKIWYPGKFLTQLLSNQSETLHNLFRTQDELLEHKFPYNYIAIHEALISCAGDIYREMTHRHPHYGYVEEKWGTLNKYCFRPGGLTSGDFSGLKQLIQTPSYKKQRDIYLENLSKLRAETEKADINPKREKVMVESLDMIRELINWFESLDPHRLPTNQLGELTDAISAYFPKEFWEA